MVSTGSYYISKGLRDSLLRTLLLVPFSLGCAEDPGKASLIHIGIIGPSLVSRHQQRTVG